MLLLIDINPIFLVSLDNSTLEAIKPTFNDFISVYIPIYSAIIGSLSAFIFLILHERFKEKKVVNKIKSLINSDFSEFYKDITKDMQFIRNERDKLGTIDSLVNKLISGTVDFSEFYSKYGIFYELEYWQAIISSGSLLKLEKDEISRVQAVSNSMEWYNAELREMYRETNDSLSECMFPQDSDQQYEDEPDPESVKDILDGYFADVLSMMKDCIDDLEELRKFSWIKF